jgi:hypothetical protein
MPVFVLSSLPSYFVCLSIQAKNLLNVAVSPEIGFNLAQDQQRSRKTLADTQILRGELLCADK